MIQYSVLIVDDEPLARQVIRDYLKNYPDMRIIGEADNGLDGVQMIQLKSPDIVFLDIQMPELNGFEVIKQLDHFPHIIFSTAYDEYAIRAFEINAVDYLLKPYDQKRFDKSIQRIRRELSSGKSEIDRLAALLNNATKSNEYLDRLLIPTKDRMIFITTTDIFYIQAIENYVSLVTETDSYLLLQKISDLENRLDPKLFFRIHRSYIVNLNRVKSIDAWLKSSYKVTLINGKELPLGRRRIKEFKKAFGL